jgi:RNA polymerase sigma-70 factor, ECF subfamily
MQPLQPLGALSNGDGMRGDTDQALLGAYVLRRDQQAFLTLYDRHSPAMFALARRLLGGNDADASDVLQEAWLRILPRLAVYRGDSALRTWMCGFVVNGCRERFRAPLFADATHAVTTVNYARKLDLERALAALPDGYRAVIVLHDIEGYTHREIAEALQIEEGTSKSQLSRGRDALRRHLGMANPRI